MAIAGVEFEASAACEVPTDTVTEATTTSKAAERARRAEKTASLLTGIPFRCVARKKHLLLWSSFGQALYESFPMH